MRKNNETVEDLKFQLKESQRLLRVRTKEILKLQNIVFDQNKEIRRLRELLDDASFATDFVEEVIRRAKKVDRSS